MPLDLDTPHEDIRTTRRVEVTAHTVSSKRNELHIGYETGDIVDGVFVPEAGVRLESFGAQELLAAIANANVYANAMPSGQVDVYEALKLALYDTLKARLALSGVVT